MHKIFIAVTTAIALCPPLAVAQTPQPYAGLETRPIKALSAQQIADLKAGRGMGFALAAELNGYPGPVHVLELADQLGLTGDQKAEMTRLFDAMKAEAVPLGERLIAQEAALDALFAERRASDDTVGAATAEIGTTQGQLRAAHLKYHLATLQALQPEQVRRYGELRGYTNAAPNTGTNTGSSTGTPHQHRH
jgi:Spy/CpxP family protein refolding chaperone